MRVDVLLLLAVIASCVGLIGTVPNGRPPIAKRMFSSPSVERVIVNITSRMKDTDLAVIFTNCFPNTLDTTIYYTPHDILRGGLPDTFVITGDIHAMWLRDSTNQVWPYLKYATEDPTLQRMLQGVIGRQVRNVLLEPYADAYERELIVREHKYELDSLAAVLRLSTGYHTATQDKTPFDAEWLRAVQLIIHVVTVQQAATSEPLDPYWFQRPSTEPTDTLSHGRGFPAARTGMSKSPFRPSDDSTIFQFLIPSNAMMIVQLRAVAQLLRVLSLPDADVIAGDADALANEMDVALKNYAINPHPLFGTLYSYEVDGFGNNHYMDDANVPSLLSLPYINYLNASDPVYQTTRKFLLSTSNPWFMKGSVASGIGGPHVGWGSIWPMSIMIQALTSDNGTEVAQCLQWLKGSAMSTGFMHESFSMDSFEGYSRPWFAWANSLFGELVLTIAEKYPQLIF